MLVEIESLVAPSPLANPRRIANGVDTGRVNMLCAVLSRRAGLALHDQDVYVNVTGVWGREEPAPTSGWRWPSLQRCGTGPWARVPPVSARSGSRGTCATSRAPTRRTSEMSKMGFGRIIRPEGTSEGPPDKEMSVEESTLEEAVAVALLSPQRRHCLRSWRRPRARGPWYQISGRP